MIKKGFLKGITVFILGLILWLLLMWLPGVSLTLDGVLVRDAEVAELLHLESFPSGDVVVYRFDFFDLGDKAYVVDRITRPFGVLYRSQWFTGWFRGCPSMFSDCSFVLLRQPVQDEIFIYIEPKEVASFMIGNILEKVYTLQEAREAVDSYILITPDSDYIAIREAQEKWPYLGIIAFDQNGVLIEGMLWDSGWYDQSR